MIIMAKLAKHEQDLFIECLDICHSMAVFFSCLMSMLSSLESKTDLGFCLFISLDAVPCCFIMNTCHLIRLKVTSGEVGDDEGRW